MSRWKMRLGAYANRDVIRGVVHTCLRSLRIIIRRISRGRRSGRWIVTVASPITVSRFTTYVVRADSPTCVPRVGLRRGGFTRRSDRGSGSWLWSPRRSESIERKGKKSFRQTRIPEASASLQGSRINDLRAMIFRILAGDTVRSFNICHPSLSVSFFSLSFYRYRAKLVLNWHEYEISFHGCSCTVKNHRTVFRRNWNSRSKTHDFSRCNERRRFIEKRQTRTIF